VNCIRSSTWQSADSHWPQAWKHPICQLRRRPYLWSSEGGNKCSGRWFSSLHY